MQGTLQPAFNHEAERMEAVAPYGSLAAWFDAVCAQHPDRHALTLGDQHMTFAELQEAAERVAGGLEQRGIGRGALVAILMERSFEMVAAMLGVVRAGAAYLPLDLRYPEARLQQTIADAQPAAVLIARVSEQSLPRASLGAPCLILEDLFGTCSKAGVDEIGPDDLAYVIYTSGSTGRPKGVEVTHGNVCNLFRGTDALFGFSEQDVWTMFHSFAFDFSVWEMWGSLLYGGRLVLVPYTVSRAPDEFRRLLAKENVTVLNQTPSAFLLLDGADEFAGAKLALRLVIFGGEALAPGLLRGWMSRHGDQAPQLVNMYGITETTVHVTYRRMLASDAGEPDSLIGEPFAGVQLQLLDDALMAVPTGATGELCVGGTGVARGYLRRAELTAERFVKAATGRFYRSGDMARRRDDGQLIYLGRRDGQVKIAGFRIEMGEVEAALAAYSAVAQGCVLAQPGPDGALRIEAYFVGRTAAPLPVAELSSFLQQRLPAHMVPRVYRQLVSFPLNGNGKIDRTALAAAPAIDAARQGGKPAAGDTAQALVQAAWCRVLGLETIANDENFFDVGGTSLLLVRLRAELERDFDRRIPVTLMFECTTVLSMAQHLGMVKHVGDSRVKPAATPAINTNAARQREAFARARQKRGKVDE